MITALEKARVCQKKKMKLLIGENEETERKSII